MGRRATGKTSASQYLTETWGAQAWTVAERIKQISYALVQQTGDLGALLEVVLLDPELRDEASRQLLTYADNYQPEPGNKPIRLLQDVGEILRHLHPRTLYCWEEDLIRRIEANPAPFIVVDARAKESHHFFCDQRDYASLLITAPEAVRQARMAERDEFVVVDPAATQHVSETDVDQLKFHFVINNDQLTDLQSLYTQLDDIVTQLSGSQDTARVE